MTMTSVISPTLRRRLLSSPNAIVTFHQPQRRTQHTTNISASEAASQLLSTYKSQPPLIRHQLLDANQLQKLSLTLNRPRLHPTLPPLSTTSPPLPSGTILPPGYHLAYFTPSDLEADLGPDGTDRSFNAPAPFTRRMWAGGQMEWGPADAGLRIGEVAEERTRLVSAVAKKGRREGGDEMVLVEVEKEFWGERGRALVDRRSWIFRKELTAATQPVAEPTEGTVIRGPSTVVDEQVDGSAYPIRRLRWSPVALFRFSALTFNGHKIHYDQSWTRSVENHRAQVVHGPLNLVCMLDYWRDVGGGKGAIAGIEYRAMAPLYAGDEYSIRAESPAGEGGDVEILVEKDGVVCMKGEIRTHR